MEYEITSRDIATSEQKLLYLILQELKEINLKLLPTTVEVKEKTIAKTCKHCGGVHDNAGQYSSCARKHKKEGIKE